MTAQRYQAIFDWFRARPAALRALEYAQKISVLGVYLVYGAVLAVTLWQRSGQFWRVLAVPSAVYVLGAAWRGRLSAGGGCSCDPRADRGALPQRRTGWPGLWRRGGCDRLPFMT